MVIVGIITLHTRKLSVVSGDHVHIARLLPPSFLLLLLVELVYFGAREDEWARDEHRPCASGQIGELRLKL